MPTIPTAHGRTHRLIGLPLRERPFVSKTRGLSAPSPHLWGARRPTAYSRAFHPCTRTYEPSPLESVSPTVGIDSFPFLA
jgi:hypothetical protein